MTEIYDPAYPTGDDDDEDVQSKDDEKSNTMNRTSKARSASLREPVNKTSSNEKKNQSTCKVGDSPKVKKSSDNISTSRRKANDKQEVNGEDVKLSPKSKSPVSVRADSKTSINIRKTKCQDKATSKSKCLGDTKAVIDNSESLVEDSVDSERNNSNPLSKENKNICLRSSTDNNSSKLDLNVKDAQKENSSAKSEENSNDNLSTQHACSSEAESSDSRCSGSSGTSNSQNAHKRKFGKFRLLDSDLLSTGTCTDQTQKNETSRTEKTPISDDRTDANTDNKNEKACALNESSLETGNQNGGSSVTSSDLSSQVNEKEDSGCEETIVRRSSRIRLIVEKKEKAKEKGKPEKTKKGKTEQKDNTTEKKKLDKDKTKEDKTETKGKEEPAIKQELETNQKDKSSPSQDKKEKNVRTKANNGTKGRGSVKIDEQKRDSSDENKHKKPESHVPSPVLIQSSSPKHEGKKDLEDIPKPEKVKSRWRRSSELERGELSGGSTPTYMLEVNERISPVPSALTSILETQCVPEKHKNAESDGPQYEKIEENIYLFERRRSKCKKEVRRMLCDCSLTKEEREKKVPGCGEDCLNRLLMIECGYRCATGDACTNKRFQKKEYAETEAFKTVRKGWGLRSLEALPQGTFVMEYVGEVLSPQEFKQRVKHYAREKTQHYYFMALKSDEIIDATCKGNLSRFINHSCDPNCETQKWTVNGELRIGFFTRRAISRGEELTFDYQFQRYGKEAQKCFCESYNCRGCIGDDGKQLALKPSQNRNSVPKRRKPADDRKREIVEDLALEDEIERLSAVGGLRNREQTLVLARVMVRTEDNDTRRRLLDIIENTTEQACLRLFLDYHGLSLLWSWMVDLGDDANLLKTQILRILTRLPIPNKTMLLDSKILNLVERWSKQISYQKSDRESGATETEPSNKKLRLLEDITSDSESPVISPHNLNSENYLPDDNKIDSSVCMQSNTSCSYNSSLPFDQTNEIKLKCSKEKSSDMQLDKKSEYSARKPPLLPNPVCVRESLETAGLKDESTNNSNSDEVMRYGGDAKSSVGDGRVDEESRDMVDYEDRTGVATMANKLLEVWSGLKEVFRIPRLEKQKRREDEQEADRHEYEYSRSVRNQDQKWQHPKDKYNFGRDKQYKEKGREFENRQRDYDNRPRDYDKRCRDFENRSGDFENNARDYDNRSLDFENRSGDFNNESMDFSADITEEQNYLMDACEWRERDEKWFSKPNRRTNVESEDIIARPRKSPLLPTPPRLTKAERRHLFALEVQQQEEEALRHQQEQEQPIIEYQSDENYAYQSDSTYPQYFEVDSSYVQQVPATPDTQMQISGASSSPQALIMPDTTSESPVAPMTRMPLLPTPTYIDSPHHCPQAPLSAPIPTPLPTSLPAPLPVPHPTPHPPHPGSHPPHPGTHPPPHHPVPHPVSHPPPHPGPLHPPPGPLSAPPPTLHTAPPPTLHAAPPPALHSAPPPALHSAPPPTLHSAPPPGPHPLPHPVSHPPPHPLPNPAPHLLPHPHPASQLGPHSVVPSGPLNVQAPVSLPSSFSEQPPPAIGYPPSGMIYPQAPATQDVSQVPYVSTPATPMPAPPPVAVQTAPPTSYHTDESQFINRQQQMYYGQPPVTVPLSDPSVVMQQPLDHQTASTIHMEPTSTMIEENQHSSPPPKLDKPTKLPPGWKTAKDDEGNIYYYHSVTRQTQWDPPSADQIDEDMDLGTPTYDEPKQSKKKGTTTAAADTSSEVAKKIRELFRTKMSSFIVQCLNPYRKPDCKVGRISSTEDFKHLARKLTHFVMAKELKHCKNVEDLECNESVKHKAKDFINKYMAKFGHSYRKDKLSSPKDE